MFKNSNNDETRTNYKNKTILIGGGPGRKFKSKFNNTMQRYGSMDDCEQ